jgi:hypothetical protein
MSFEFDEKGKIFTDVVQKISIEALIQTTTHLIRGLIHVPHGERVKNELDRNELFLAVTDASVLGSDGKPVQQAAFLAVRRDQIVWIIPSEDRQDAPAGGGGDA